VDRHFTYAVDGRFLPVLLPLGFRRSKDGVALTDDGAVAATFGLLSLRTDRDNIAGAHITTDYRWWTAIGARLSLADDGLTFGTNARAGVCIHFTVPVPSLLRRKGHSALTVTVEDLEGLVDALGRSDPPGR
jgi:hypothetical protein